MLWVRCYIAYVPLLVAILGAGNADAAPERFPSKPVRILTGGVGGSNDIFARVLSKELSDTWGTSVIVDNRPSGVIPMEIVSKAPPDGYTILENGNSIWTVPLFEKVAYDPLKDFAPVTIAITSPSVLVVNPSVPVKSVKELVELAKAKPGQINYAAGAIGSSNHLATAVFKSMAGIDIVYIQYKNIGQSIPALIAGEVQMMISSTVSLAPQIAAGKVKALAVTSAQPSALAPGLPTVAQSGVPGYRADQMLNIFVPARTPPSIVQQLNRDIVRVLSKPEVKEKLFSTGVEAVGSSPEELAATMRAEMERTRKVIKEVGIRSN